MRIQSQRETFAYRIAVRYAGPDSLDWQHGVPQPLTAQAFEEGRALRNNNGRMTNPDTYVDESPTDYSDHSTALANLGESQYSIGAWPKDSSLGPADAVGNTHNWGIDRRIGSDIKNPEHWTAFNQGAGDYERKSPAKFLGAAPSKQHAMAAAEKNWNLHKQHMQKGQMPEVSQHGDPFGSKTNFDDDDYGMAL